MTLGPVFLTPAAQATLAPNRIDPELNKGSYRPHKRQLFNTPCYSSDAFSLPNVLFRTQHLGSSSGISPSLLGAKLQVHTRAYRPSLPTSSLRGTFPSDILRGRARFKYRNFRGHRTTKNFLVSPVPPLPTSSHLFLCNLMLSSRPKEYELVRREKGIF